MTLDDFLNAGDPIELDRQIELPRRSWDFACLLGQTISQIRYGYPDSYDGVDYQDFASEVYMADPEPLTYRTALEQWLNWSDGDMPGDNRIMAYLKDNPK